MENKGLPLSPPSEPAETDVQLTETQAAEKDNVPNPSLVQETEETFQPPTEEDTSQPAPEPDIQTTQPQITTEDTSQAAPQQDISQIPKPIIEEEKDQPIPIPAQDENQPLISPPEQELGNAEVSSNQLPEIGEQIVQPIPIPAQDENQPLISPPEQELGVAEVSPNQLPEIGDQMVQPQIQEENVAPLLRGPDPLVQPQQLQPPDDQTQPTQIQEENIPSTSIPMTSPIIEQPQLQSVAEIDVQPSTPTKSENIPTTPLQEPKPVAPTPAPDERLQPIQIQAESIPSTSLQETEPVIQQPQLQNVAEIQRPKPDQLKQVRIVEKNVPSPSLSEPNMAIREQQLLNAIQADLNQPSTSGDAKTQMQSGGAPPSPLPEPQPAVQQQQLQDAAVSQIPAIAEQQLPVEKAVINPDPILPEVNQPIPPKEDAEEQPAQMPRARTGSVIAELLSQAPDMHSTRRGSRRSEDIKLGVNPLEDVAAVHTPEEPRRKSTIKSVGDVGRRKSSVYNPFTSFERHVSISEEEPDPPKKKPVLRQPRDSIGEPQSRRPTIVELKSAVRKPLSPTSSLRAVKTRSISAVDLAKQDIAVCFFPEEPPWDEEDDEHKFGSFPPSTMEFTGAEELGKGEDVEEEEDATQERPRWHSRLVYILALVTYSISFSNVYHFPALVYHFGGVSFLIPYTFFMIVMGYPLHFLESSLGQYSQSGPVKVWDCAPVARGVGLSMFVLCLFIAYYYNMYAAYSVIYFSHCFYEVLPWQDCDDPSPMNFTCVPRMCAHTAQNHYTPAEHYFFDHVLKVNYIGQILEQGLGKMVWSQVLGFFLAWVIVYFCILQGVRSIGKVVFWLVIFPYFVLLMLLVAGFMLEGSSRGMYMLFAADFSQLLDIQVWRSAAEQVFFELGVCQGTPLAYASYCHHRNPTHIDSAIICVVNYLTSILCAVVIFNILGALSMEMGIPITDIIHQGPALLFIVYPEALSRVPGSHFWCVMFFLMLFLVSIGSQIAVMETIMTVIFDEFKGAQPYRWVINLLFCCSLFSIGIVLCTANGFYIVHLLNSMAGMMPRLPIAVCMVGTIVFIYGIRKYCEDMHFMLDYYPNLFMRVCFFLIPFLLVMLIIPSWILYNPLTIMERPYLIDAIICGWVIVAFILVWILLGAIYWYAYCRYIGHPNYVWRSLTVWGPRNYDTRIARTEFSSEFIANFTREWNKKTVQAERKEGLK